MPYDLIKRKLPSGHKHENFIYQLDPRGAIAIDEWIKVVCIFTKDYIPYHINRYIVTCILIHEEYSSSVRKCFTEEA